MRKVHIHLASERVCPTHGSRGVLPCAWPNCENGLPDAQFQEAPLYERQKLPIYSRREWQSPLGGTYYSWESDALPNWFFTSQTFWNEARRNKLIQDSFPKVVYHYTSIEGFMGIVDQRSIWMSDFSYLNDRRELIYGADLVLTAIKRMSETENDSEILRLLSTWSGALGSLQNRVCIASFTKDDDSLSQWRAYGPLAVGFPVHPLALHVDQATLQPVEYRPEVQRKLVDIYLRHLTSAYARDFSAGRLTQISDIYHKVDRLLGLIVFFKDPAFKTEEEYRLAYIDFPEVLSSLGLEKPPKSFRVSKGKLIPYVPSVNILQSEHRKFDLEISEVVLGPECDDLLERGVREFLGERGMQSVNVRRSIVPLRP